MKNKICAARCGSAPGRHRTNKEMELTMKRFLLAGTAAIALTLPQAVMAQSPDNNPTFEGLYLGVGLGVSVLDDTDFDNGNSEITAEADNGVFGDLSLGYTFPSGPVSFRAEGQLAARVNPVDNVNGAEAVDESDISSIAGMANGYIDYYILPNMAVTGGAGLGFATVQVDIAVDLNGVDTLLFDEQNDTGLAYQGMLGARYDFDGGSSIDLGYTYFVANDLSVENEAGDDDDFDYVNHAFNIGYSYRF